MLNSIYNFVEHSWRAGLKLTFFSSAHPECFFKEKMYRRIEMEDSIG
jgi:hypothetical protein